MGVSMYSNYLRFCSLGPKIISGYNIFWENSVAKSSSKPPLSFLSQFQRIEETDKSNKTVRHVKRCQIKYSACSKFDTVQRHYSKWYKVFKNSRRSNEQKIPEWTPILKFGLQEYFKYYFIYLYYYSFPFFSVDDSQPSSWFPVSGIFSLLMSIYLPSYTVSDYDPKYSLPKK